MRRARIALPIITLLVVSIPSIAHHGNAAFASSQKTIKGTLTEWVWSNPHSFLLVDAKDDGGNVQHWRIEATAIPSLIDIGITKISFKPGDQVTVTLNPVKSGEPVGRVMNVVLPNGKTVYFTSQGSGLTVDGNEEDTLIKVNRAALTVSRDASKGTAP